MNCLLKFSAINLYFINNHSLLERGENSYMSKNVLRVDFDPQLLIIRGKVSASMKARTYDVEVLPMVIIKTTLLLEIKIYNVVGTSSK